MTMEKVTCERFECKRGDLTIRGLAFRGPGEHLPIAIVSHGFLANYQTTRGYAAQLAAWGYAAYCFDFCGGCVVGHSDGRTQDMSVLTEVEDLLAVIGYAKSRPGNDPDRVTLMGCSQGGFVSALTAARLGEAVERLILFYPALCIPDDARAGHMMFYDFDPESPPETITGGPIKLGALYPLDVRDMDVNAEIAKYPGPVLIVHGTEDDIVVPHYAMEAALAYGNAAPRRCDLAVLEGAGHSFSGDHGRAAMELVRHFTQGRHMVLSVDVELTHGKSWTWTPVSSVLRLPFTGHAQTPWFTGEVQPGAADVQHRTLGKAPHFRAEYTLKGEDYTGAHCTVHIVNTFDGKAWTPVIDTDSAALSFLNGVCSAALEQRRTGPVVRIFK